MHLKTGYKPLKNIDINQAKPSKKDFDMQGLSEQCYP